MPQQEPHEVLKEYVGQIVLPQLHAKEWILNDEPVQYYNTHNTTCKLKYGNKATRLVRNLDPDGSIRVRQARLPFFILDLCHSQRAAKIRQKMKYWVQGCNLHITVLVVVHIRNESNQIKVYMDVIKPQKKPDTSSQNPNGFIVECSYIISHEEIFPAVSQLAFDIDKKDVFPKGWPGSAAFWDDKVTFRLASFRSLAKDAVDLIHDEAAGRSSPIDPNQTSLLSPTSSGDEDEAIVEEEDDVSMADDKEYFPPDEADSDGEEPS
ncbi:MAG: hypothetical protein Q9196_006254, partial [Gyalolechia fulgens]